jgi:hypothetical protein
MTPSKTIPVAASLVADYLRARKNIARLGQIAALAERRFANHVFACPECATTVKIEGDSDNLCDEGHYLLVVARVYAQAHDTMTGRMIWQ